MERPVEYIHDVVGGMPAPRRTTGKHTKRSTHSSLHCQLQIYSSEAPTDTTDIAGETSERRSHKEELARSIEQVFYLGSLL